MGQPGIPKYTLSSFIKLRHQKFEIRQAEKREKRERQDGIINF